jgi:molecular chaperone DnaJ
VIDMPKQLNTEQKAAVEQLSKVMNGNPRERILRAAGQH